MSDKLSGSRLALALQGSAVLGEGLQWHAATNRWWWTDIQQARLHAWSERSGALTTFALPDRLGSFAHARSGKILLGLAKRLAIADMPCLDDDGSPALRLRSLIAIDSAEPRTRINDGRCDRQGNFVFATMNEASDGRAIGSFFQYSIRRGLHRLSLPAAVIPNSICFSPDGRTMYFCDTPTRKIMQCDYDAESAGVRNVREFVNVSDENAFPDGSIVDADGCLWNAQWGAGRVCRYSPAGALLEMVHLPAAHSTCPALGGPCNDVLMVTTAREGLSAEQLDRMPLSGSVFSSTLSCAVGIPEPLFDDRDLCCAEP